MTAPPLGVRVENARHGCHLLPVSVRQAVLVRSGDNEVSVPVVGAERIVDVLGLRNVREGLQCPIPGGHRN